MMISVTRDYHWLSLASHVGASFFTEDHLSPEKREFIFFLLDEGMRVG